MFSLVYRRDGDGGCINQFVSIVKAQLHVIGSFVDGIRHRYGDGHFPAQQCMNGRQDGNSGLARQTGFDAQVFGVGG